MDQRVYRPLRRYLRALPAEQMQLQLTLADLEALLGPRSSSGLPRWTLLGAADAMVTAGCRVHCDPRQATITVTRQQPTSEEPA